MAVATSDASERAVLMKPTSDSSDRQDLGHYDGFTL